MRSLEVNITRADRIRLLAYAMPRGRSGQLIFGLLAVMLLWINMSQQGLPKSGADWFGLVMTVVIFLLGAAMLAFVFAILGMLVNTRKGRGLGPRTLTLRDDGLLVSAHANQRLIRPGAAYALIKRRDYIYVQMSPSLFFVVPRRCFKDAHGYESFWNAIQGLRRPVTHARPTAVP